MSLAPGKHRARPGHYLELALMVFLETLVRPLSRRSTVAVARFFGNIMGGGLRARRKLVEEHLDIAFGPTTDPAARDQLIREMYHRIVLTTFEFLQADIQSPDLFVGIDGEEKVSSLVEKGPILMVTGHIGNWEAFGLLLGPRNLQGAMLAKPLHNPLVQRRVLKRRLNYKGAEVIHTSGTMKAVVDCVRKGKSVGFVADQDARRAGVFVEFFGRPASTARGPAVFALKLGLPLVPMFVVRDPSPLLPLRLIVGDPIYGNADADHETEVVRITQEHTRQLEEVVREHPADYFWLHRRWKTRPKSNPSTSEKSSS